LTVFRGVDISPQCLYINHLLSINKLVLSYLLLRLLPQDEDIWLSDGVKKDVNREIIDKLVDKEMVVVDFDGFQ
jgi:hypothetical protein